MKPEIKKAASGKTMRVATLFTGAAACAAAFAPAAHSADGIWAGLAARNLHSPSTTARCMEGYAKLSLKKYSPIAARNDDLKVFSGRR